MLNCLLKQLKLSPNYTVEVLDFVGYLKEKAAKRQEGCPICSKHRDPKTGELRFNAETVAAFEEGDAMLRKEIPAKWCSSLNEMMVDLDD